MVPSNESVHRKNGHVHLEPVNFVHSIPNCKDRLPELNVMKSLMKNYHADESQEIHKYGNLLIKKIKIHVSAIRLNEDVYKVCTDPQKHVYKFKFNKSSK